MEARLLLKVVVLIGEYLRNATNMRYVKLSTQYKIQVCLTYVNAVFEFVTLHILLTISAFLNSAVLCTCAAYNSTQYKKCLNKLLPYIKNYIKSQ